MPSPLTPKSGYRFTLVQYDGDRPSAALDCTLCDYVDTPPVPVDGDAAAVAVVIMRAVDRWIAHHCPTRPLSDSTIAYPQESPATPERKSSNAQSHQGDGS